MVRTVIALFALGIFGIAVTAAFGFEWMNQANMFAILLGLALTAGAVVEIAVLYNNKD